MKFNSRIFEHLMIEKGVDQRRVAAGSGISEPTITRMKRGEVFTSEKLAAIAKFLECSPLDLLDVTEYAPPRMVAPASGPRQSPLFYR